LVASPFLAAVSEQDQRRIIQLCTRRRYATGAFLFYGGDAGDSLHLIVKGKVAILAGGALGDVLMLSVLSVGEVFGELALIGEEPHRTTSVRALEPTETLVLRRDDFEELRRQHPSVDRFLVALLAARVRRLTTRIVETAEVPAATRVYRRIVELADTFGATTPEASVPVTQDQLASMAGVKLRVTNRVIGDARRDGLLDTGRGRLMLYDLTELRRRAGLRSG
jgi:CRP/FNR family transcriptional regulator, cyclic AMP receptor protein